MANNLKLFITDYIPTTGDFSELLLSRLDSESKYKIVKDKSSPIIGLEHIIHFDVYQDEKLIFPMTICKNMDNVPEIDLKAGQGIVLIVPDYLFGLDFLSNVKNLFKYKSFILNVNDEIIA